MTATIKADDLAAMLRAIAPHMSKDDDLPVLRAIQVEASGGHLFAAATDRFTLAVRRAENCGGHADWRAIIPANAIDLMRTWLETWSRESIELDLNAVNPDSAIAQTLTLYGPGRRLSLTVQANAGHIQHAPNWRKLLRGMLDREIAPAACLYTGRYLGRWVKAGEQVRIWQTGPGKPLLVIGTDLIGAQMPIHEEQSKHAEELDLWRGFLTRATAEVDGEVYGLGQRWRDADGDLWTYSGDDNSAGEPLMALDDLEDRYTLAEVIADYGPLTATGIPV